MKYKLLIAIGAVNAAAGKTIITAPDVDLWCNKLMRYLNFDRKFTEKIAYTKLMYFALNFNYFAKHNAFDTNIPLERITSKQHAINIYHAYIRHTKTNYDTHLHDLRKLEQNGIIKENTHKNLARKNISSQDVLNVLNNNFCDLDKDIVRFIKNRLRNTK